MESLVPKLNIFKTSLYIATILLVVFFVLSGFVEAQQLKNPLGDTNTLEELIARIMEIVGIIAGLVITPIIVFGGIRYMLAREDPVAQGKAKSIIIYALMGFGIILIAEGIGAIIRVALT